jgi:hypothetical protein
MAACGAKMCRYEHVHRSLPPTRPLLIQLGARRNAVDRDEEQPGNPEMLH